MKQSFSSQDLQALFTFPFKDPDWQQKGLTGSLLVVLGLVVPILPSIFLMGYMAQIMKGIIRTNRKPFLPKWDDWGNLFNDGWKLFGAMFISMLPVLLLFFLGMGLAMGPAILLSFLDASGAGEPTELLPLAILGPAFGTTLFIIAVPFNMIIGAFLPVVLSHIVVKEDFLAAFRVREWWIIFRANATGFILSYLIALALGFVLTLAVQLLSATLVFCCLVPFVLGPATFYTSLITHSLYAQAYRAGVQALPEQ